MDNKWISRLRPGDKVLIIKIYKDCSRTDQCKGGILRNGKKYIRVYGNLVEQWRGEDSRFDVTSGKSIQDNIHMIIYPLERSEWCK